MRILLQAERQAVGLEHGRIVSAAGRFERTLRIPGGEMTPGLVNAHDHLHRNHYGRLGRPPYANAYEWGRHIHAEFAELIREAALLPRRDALLIGAWKNLFAGVTTVVHHDRWDIELGRRFPLRVARIRTVHSTGFDAVGLRREARRGWAAGGGTPLSIHLAEGVNEGAAEEVRELDRIGLLDTRLLAVHAVGVDDDGSRRLRLAGAACIWCPTSNLFLFGRTSPAALLAPGIDVLLGSDSLLTADGDLLDELHAARRLRLVDDDRLRDAVSATAARRLGLPAPALSPGAPGDVVVLRRPLLEARSCDVALVMVGGEIRLAQPDVEGLDGFDLTEVQGPSGVRRLVPRDAPWPGTVPGSWIGAGSLSDRPRATLPASAVHAPAQ